MVLRHKEQPTIRRVRSHLNRFRPEGFVQFDDPILLVLGCLLRKREPIEPPLLTSIVPNNAVAGSAALEMEVNGAGFNETSLFRFDGTDVPTTFVDSTRLLAQVVPYAVRSHRSVHVHNSGAQSNSLAFTTSRKINDMPKLGVAELKRRFPEVYRDCFRDEVSRLRARLDDDGDAIITGTGESPPEIDPTIPPPAKSLDELSPAEMKARIEKLEKDLAESNEMLANVTRSGARDINVVVNNARKDGAYGQVDPLGELTAKDKARRQNILTSALKNLRKR